jgi:hypothetical protein
MDEPPDQTGSENANPTERDPSPMEEPLDEEILQSTSLIELAAKSKERGEKWTSEELFTLLRAYIQNLPSRQGEFGSLPATNREWTALVERFKEAAPQTTRSSRGIRQLVLRKLPPTTQLRSSRAAATLLRDTAASVFGAREVPSRDVSAWSPQEDATLLLAHVAALDAECANAGQIDAGLAGVLHRVCTATARTPDAVLRRLCELLVFDGVHPVVSLCTKLEDLYRRPEGVLPVAEQPADAGEGMLENYPWVVTPVGSTGGVSYCVLDTTSGQMVRTHRHEDSYVHVATYFSTEQPARLKVTSYV